ncbi:MAG: ribosome maturation factor RimP [Polyangiales bacterium]
MRNDKEQLQELRPLVEPVCAAHGLALVDLGFTTQHGRVLQILIERPDQPDGRSGVSLADCQAVSRDLSTVLDVEGEALMLGSYRLEVSSPGLERPLVARRDYERFAGREVNLRTSHPVGGRRRLQGVLRGIEGDVVKVNVSGEELGVPLADIAKANLIHRF